MWVTAVLVVALVVLLLDVPLLPCEPIRYI